MLFRRLMLLVMTLGWCSAGYGYDGNWCLDFDGDDNYVSVPYDAELNPEQFTVEFWAKVEDNSGVNIHQSPVFSRKEGYYGYNFYVNPDNKWQFWIGQGAGATGWDVITDIEPVELDTWVHIAGTYDGSKMRLYKNAELIGERDVSRFAPNTSEVLKIGCGAYGFDGKIDEVRIWNIVKDAVAIEYLMNDKLVNQEGNPSLAGYWRFDEGAGNTVSSSTWESRTGTITNYQLWAASDAPLTYRVPSHNQFVTFPSGNFIRNWNFEMNDVGWTTSPGSFSIKDINEQYFGDASRGLTIVDADILKFSYRIENTEAVVSDVKNVLQYVRGNDVVFSIMVKTPSALDISIGIDDGSNNASFPFHVVPGQWVKLKSDPVRIGQNTHELDCYISTLDPVTFNVDGAVLEPVSPYGAYESHVLDVYYDEFGRKIQTQTWTGTGDIVQGWIHHKNGRPEYISLKFHKENAEHGFICDMWKELKKYYSPDPAANPEKIPDAGGYPYTKFIYYEEPQARIHKIVPPGADFQNAFTEYAYDTNPVNFPTSGAAGRFQQTTITNPNGIKTLITYDKLKRAISTIRDFDMSDPGHANSEQAVVYDALGNIVKEISPLAIESPTQYGRLCKDYRYNSIGQLTSAEGPDMDDGAESNEHDIDVNPDITYKFDSQGKLALYQNASMKAQSTTGNCYFTRNVFDPFSRLIAVEDCFSSSQTWDQLDPDAVTGMITAATKVAIAAYDALPNFSVAPWSEYEGRRSGFNNTQGRLTASAYYNELAPGNGYGFTLYSYNENGTVEFIIQQLPGEHKICKSVEYVYDCAGKLVAVDFNGEFTVHYGFNADGLLTTVGTTPNGIEFCEYIYGKCNQLLGVRYYGDGDQVIQTREYTYNIRGWLKAINGIGQVEMVTRDDQGVPLEGFVNYFAEEIDYTSGGYTSGGGASGYYNGNISKTSYAVLGAEQSDDHFYSYSYQYDNLDMLTTADYVGGAGEYTGLLPSIYDVYDVRYDASGRLTELNRKHELTTSTEEVLRYSYYEHSNRLKNVIPGDNTTEQFEYDANGNLVVDGRRGIGDSAPGGNKIRYNSSNMPILMPNNIHDHSFYYDATGNRVGKIISDSE